MSDIGSEDSASTTAPVSAPTRQIKACERCHRLKTKCRPGASGSAIPCQRCEEARRSCERHPTPPPRARPSQLLKEHEKQIEELQRSIAKLQGRQEALESRLGSVPGNIDEHRLGSPERDTVNLQDGSPEADTLNSQSGSPQYFNTTDLEDPIASDVIRSHRLLPKDPEEGRSRKRRREEDGVPTEPSIELQQIAFDIFSKRCALTVNFLDFTSPSYTRQNVQLQSTVLYWSIIAVGSKEAAELAPVFDYAVRVMAKGVRMTLGGASPSLYDFMGCVLAMLWLSPVRPPGHIVAMAYELDLHNSALELSTKGPDEDRCMRYRLWCQLVLFDLFYSFASARPRLISETEVYVDAERLLTLPNARFQDFKASAQLEILLAVRGWHSQIRQRGASLLSDEVASTIFLDSHITYVDLWLEKWLPWAERLPNDPSVFSGKSSIKTAYWLARMFLAFPFLRGVRQANDITPGGRVALGKAFEAATQLLEVALEHFQPPVVNYVSEVTNVCSALAASFLLKVVHLLPGQFNATATIQLVERGVALFDNISGRYYAKLLGRMVTNVKAGIVEPIDWATELGLTDFSHWDLDGQWGEGLLDNFMNFTQ
ncbi:hypothetical protein BCR39DRAFT_550566 [Naematelia encephala]|uniref:Zn(2)-C6 fungal-type domain-containing protein n=1 Tax=Naematelia encephala TaxID=71784 RepID=A0A1Y2AK28_9TREE|nr:hypothetical protein BCR39DRAFT_550566 [Naematelia encephala]